MALFFLRGLNSLGIVYLDGVTAQMVKFSIEDLFSKFDQIGSLSCPVSCFSTLKALFLCLPVRLGSTVIISIHLKNALGLLMIPKSPTMQKIVKVE